MLKAIACYTQPGHDKAWLEFGAYNDVAYADEGDVKVRRHLRGITIVGSLTAILGIVVIISACTQTPDGTDEVSDASFLDQLQPGKVLHIKSEHYRRYGSTADNFLSDEC